MNTSAPDSKFTERDLEEGLATADINAEKNTGMNAAAPAAKTKHHHHHHHHWRRDARAKMHHRRKQKVEAKLPSVMQGADNLEQAHRRLTIKNEIVAAVGEFCGTFLFLFISFGIATIAGQQNLTAQSSQQVQGTGGASTSTSLDASQLLYSSLGFGFSLSTNAWLFFRISGGLFNPAVTLALFLTKNLTWYRTIILGFTQFVAAISAAGMAQVLIPGGINVQTKLAGSTTVAQGFFIEMFMTAQLVFAVFMLAGEKHKGTFLAPVGIGLALFIAEMWATPFTGGSLNPARTLGPDVIAAKFAGTTWIYYTAPFVGALLATGVYKFLKYAQYETAVAGQDDDAIALVMKDEKGNITGFVDQIAAEDTPEHLKKASSTPHVSPTPSMADLHAPDAEAAAGPTSMPPPAPTASQSSNGILSHDEVMEKA